jgi:hypothetical protein
VCCRHKKNDEWRASFRPALEALGKYYQVGYGLHSVQYIVLSTAAAAAAVAAAMIGGCNRNASFRSALEALGKYYQVLPGHAQTAAVAAHAQYFIGLSCSAALLTACCLPLLLLLLRPPGHQDALPSRVCTCMTRQWLDFLIYAAVAAAVAADDDARRPSRASLTCCTVRRPQSTHVPTAGTLAST